MKKSTKTARGRFASAKARAVRTRVLGIDLAARPKKTYACSLTGDGTTLGAEIHPSCDDERLRELARGCDKVAIDAPFGWPNEFVDALVAHRAGDGWPAPDDEPPELYRASLSYRATDRVVRQTRPPLSVSADKLGVTAMRCAFLLHRWSPGRRIDRTGRGRFVEVYPAAALDRWGLAASGYKGGKGGAALSALLRKVERALPGLMLDVAARTACSSNDDAFDSLIAALVARAAALGLTDPPPPGMRSRAAEEGWIHLPLRGSLPFLAREKAHVGARPALALADKLRSAGVQVDGKGYLKRSDDVFVSGISLESRRAALADLKGKGGSELRSRGKGPPKFRAAHSSAALAANTFAPFLGEGVELPFGKRTVRGSARIEAECPSGLRGIPPTLDYLIEGPRGVLAVESKCVETYFPHLAQFRASYSPAIAVAHESWRAEYNRLLEDPVRYRFLDAAQLIKHYLGLRNTYPQSRVTLVYLYWVPTNASELAPCAVHGAEVREFSEQVSDPAVQFKAMTYEDLWTDWRFKGRPVWLRAHAKELRARYGVAA